jgi:hypothetical protein
MACSVLSTICLVLLALALTVLHFAILALDFRWIVLVPVWAIPILVPFHFVLCKAYAGDLARWRDKASMCPKVIADVDLPPELRPTGPRYHPPLGVLRCRFLRPTLRLADGQPVHGHPWPSPSPPARRCWRWTAKMRLYLTTNRARICSSETDVPAQGVERWKRVDSRTPELTSVHVNSNCQASRTYTVAILSWIPRLIDCR